MSLQPDQALFMLNCTLPTLENEHRITAAVLRAIPADKAKEYRPDAVSKSAFDLAWHIAASENVFLKAVCAGAFDSAPQTKPRSMAELLAFFEETFQRNIAAIKQLTGEQLAAVVDFKGMFNSPPSSIWAFRTATPSITAASFPCICGLWARKCRPCTAKVTTAHRPATPLLPRALNASSLYST